MDEMAASRLTIFPNGPFIPASSSLPRNAPHGEVVSLLLDLILGAKVNV